MLINAILLDHCHRLSDVAIKHVNWDASKVREKLHCEIEAHAVSARDAKLSELRAGYQVNKFCFMDKFNFIKTFNM